MTLDLLEHQRTGIEFLREQPRAGLFDEPGLGKSATALLAAEEPVLVVAPAMILEGGVWDDETAKWRPEADVTQVAYTQLGQRGPRGRIERDANGFPKVALKPEYRRRWGTVVLDEAHYVKGRKTWWTSCVQQLKTDRIVLATGTPLVNWAHEAFSLLQLIYPEKNKPGAELGSYWRWVRDWFRVGSHWSEWDIGDLIDNTDAGWERWRRDNWGDRYVLRLRKDCLDLPPLTVQEMRVRMGADQKRVYKALKKDFVAWLDDGFEVATWSTAGQVTKLAQCATGIPVLSMDAPLTKGSAKLKALGELLRDRPRQTLVVGHFQNTVDRCAEVGESLGLRVAVVHGGVGKSARADAVRRFQRGELDVLCASVGTVSEGLTLHQAGCDQIIRVERSWLPSRNEQVLRRLHRIGQERPVLCIDLITEDSMDENVLELLAKKTDQQMRAITPTELKRVAA